MLLQVVAHAETILEQGVQGDHEHGTIREERLRIDGDIWIHRKRYEPFSEWRDDLCVVGF
jgi:hypothetical protein